VSQPTYRDWPEQKHKRDKRGERRKGEDEGRGERIDGVEGSGEEEHDERVRAERDETNERELWFLAQSIKL